MKPSDLFWSEILFKIIVSAYIFILGSHQIPSVAGQDKGKLVEYIYMYIYIRATWIAQTLGLPSSCPWIPVFPIAGICTEPLHGNPTPVADTDPFAHMHQHTDTQTHTLWIPPGTGIPCTVHPSAGPGSLLSLHCLRHRWTDRHTPTQTHRHKCISADPWARAVLVSPAKLLGFLCLPCLCTPAWVGRWAFYHITKNFPGGAFFRHKTSFFFFVLTILVTSDMATFRGT